MAMQTKECCVSCDSYTERAGKHDDSLYLDDGTGPYCLPCYDHKRVEELETYCAAKDTRIKELEGSKDVAYKERNRLVLFLARCFPSHRCRHPESDTSWERDWMNIICVHGPAGQMAWHIHDSELPMFEHLRLEESHWDGHTADEKYERLYRCDMNSSAIGDMRRENDHLHARLSAAEAEVARLGKAVEWVIEKLDDDGVAKLGPEWEPMRDWIVRFKSELRRLSAKP